MADMSDPSWSDDMVEKTCIKEKQVPVTTVKSVDKQAAENSASVPTSFVTKLEKSMDKIADFMGSMNDAFTNLAERQPSRGTKRKSHAISESEQDEYSDGDDAEESFIAMSKKKCESQTQPQPGTVTQASTSGDVFDDIENEYANAKTGPTVNEKLSRFVNKRFESRMTTDKVKEKMEKFCVPENCDRVHVPAVNLPVWSNLNRYTRGMDIRMSNIQRTLVSASSAIVECLETLSNTETKIDDSTGTSLLGKLTDSVAMIGHAHYDLSLRRREILRPSIQEQYKPLCGQNVPVTKWLFGDDLQKEMKEVRETGRIGKSFAKSHWSKGDNFRRRGSYGYQGQGRRPFQDRGRGKGRKKNFAYTKTNNNDN